MQTPTMRKEHTLLAAWGSYWKQNDALPSRQAALKWVNEMKAANATWVHHKMVPREQYWREMSRRATYA